LLADGRFTDGHWTHQDDRAARPDIGDHYRPTESRVAGMLSR
jgi:hypothetical protein